MKQRRSKICKYLIIVLVILIIVLVALLIKTTKNDDNVETNKEEVISTVEEQIQNEEAMKIETEYCDLYYPVKWQQNLRTEITDKDVYKVAFYGMVDGREEQHLFNIVFGGEEATIVGTLNGSVTVGFEFADFNVTEEWKDSEIEIIRAMQEDINYVLGMLSKEDEFKGQ